MTSDEQATDEAPEPGDALIEEAIAEWRAGKTSLGILVTTLEQLWLGDRFTAYLNMRFEPGRVDLLARLSERLETTDYPKWRSAEAVLLRCVSPLVWRRPLASVKLGVLRWPMWPLAKKLQLLEEDLEVLHLWDLPGYDQLSSSRIKLDAHYGQQTTVTIPGHFFGLVARLGASMDFYLSSRDDAAAIEADEAYCDVVVVGLRHPGPFREPLLTLAREQDPAILVDSPDLAAFSIDPADFSDVLAEVASLLPGPGEAADAPARPILVGWCFGGVGRPDPALEPPHIAALARAGAGLDFRVTLKQPGETGWLVAR